MPLTVMRTSLLASQSAAESSSWLKFHSCLLPMQFDDMKAVMVRVLLSSGFYVAQSRIALPPTFGIIQLVESVVNWFSKNIL